MSGAGTTFPPACNMSASSARSSQDWICVDEAERRETAIDFQKQDIFRFQPLRNYHGNITLPTSRGQPCWSWNIYHLAKTIRTKMQIKSAYDKVAKFPNSSRSSGTSQWYAGSDVTKAVRGARRRFSVLRGRDEEYSADDINLLKVLILFEDIPGAARNYTHSCPECHSEGKMTTPKAFTEESWDCTNCGRAGVPNDDLPPVPESVLLERQNQNQAQGERGWQILCNPWQIFWSHKRLRKSSNASITKMQRVDSKLGVSET
jgi:ribosomal protein L37AE/L43A